jgi:hypothetical protein
MDVVVSGVGNSANMASLLDFCHRLDVQPTELHQTSVPNMATIKIAVRLDRRAPCPRLDPAKRAELLPKLDKLVLVGNTLPLVEVARKLNISRRYLKYWFPDLCKKLGRVIN